MCSPDAACASSSSRPCSWPHICPCISSPRCNTTHCAPVHAPPSRDVACWGSLRRRGPWVQRPSDGGVTQHRQVGVRRQDPVIVVQWLPSLFWITCRSHGESLNRPLTNPFHIHLTTTCATEQTPYQPFPHPSHRHMRCAVGRLFTTPTMHSSNIDSCTFNCRVCACGLGPVMGTRATSRAVRTHPHDGLA